MKMRHGGRQIVSVSHPGRKQSPTAPARNSTALKTEDSDGSVEQTGTSFSREII